MDRSIRSFPTFVLGIIGVAAGLAVVVSDLTSLDFDETASVAGLAGGAVVLVAAVLAPRYGHDAGPDSLPQPIEPAGLGYPPAGGEFGETGYPVAEGEAAGLGYPPAQGEAYSPQDEAEEAED